MRVAWFSPLPPDRSGIAAYCAELLPLLAGRHQIELFIDDGGHAGAEAAVTPIPGVVIRGAYDFAWRHAAHPFDVCVYQLGNELCHDYMWPYLVHYPGLVVMHDGQLHQSRAAGLLRRWRFDDYRAEFSYSHPHAAHGMHEMVILGLGEAVRSLYYEYPMVRVPVEAARVVAVHSEQLADDLRADVPDAIIVRIRQGLRDLSAGSSGTTARLRATLGIPEDAVIFAAFGRATPEKRLTAVLRALGQLKSSGQAGRAHLLCVGATPRYYDVRKEAAIFDVAERVTVTGYVDDGDVGNYLALADAGLCLRWPSGRETSGSWIRCIAAGKPTIINDLAHMADVPALDPRSMQALPAGDVPPADRDPVAFTVELIDEVHMLRLAIRHLTESAGLRERLGRSARAYWQRHATVELMAEDYDALLVQTPSAKAVSRPGWPPHLTSDGTQRARAIGREMGVALDWLPAGP